MLDEIVVSAARDPRPLLDTPASATVREGEALAVRQATDFQELIGDVPGLTIEGGPRSIAQEPSIRGFQNDQIVLRVDGGVSTSTPRIVDGSSSIPTSCSGSRSCAAAARRSTARVRSAA